jgi:hypothetical protein
MQPPELMAAEFYYQDRLRQAEQRRLVKEALAGAPRRTSALLRLFSSLFGLLRKPAQTRQAASALMTHSDPFQKAA